MVSKIKLIVFVFMFSTLGGTAQNILSLDSCIEQANSNFAFDQQVELSHKISALNIKKIGKNYLPSLEFNANSTYQNEQISIPLNLSIPGFESPSAPLNLNNALLTLHQWIYDGSISRNQKAIQKATEQIAVNEVEVQRLDLKTKITQIYFSILLQNEQINILNAKIEVLNTRLKEAESAVENGVLLSSDKQLLQAEIIRLKQGITETRFGLQESMLALENLMGVEIVPTTTFELPHVELKTLDNIYMRPDYKLLNNQIALIESQKTLTKSTYLPKIGAFANGGFGLPGYNIFDDNIAPMARVGISLNWKLFDWNQGHIQRQSLSVNQEIIGLKMNQLKSQIGIQTSAQLNKINKAKALMISDQELVLLYTSVANAYANQLENGTITSAEYLQQLNKAQEAELNLQLHKLQLSVAVMNYNNLLGN